MNWRKFLLFLVVILIIFSIYNYIQISQFYVNKLKISSNKLAKPLRITQITDFHSNEKINLDKLFNEIRDFKPDIIVITGDLIDYKTRDLTLAFEVLEKSNDITSNVYFVSGNHETDHVLSKEFNDGLNQYGIRILDDTSQVLDISGNKINLFGASFFADKETYDKIFKDIKEYNYNLLLSHSPNKPIMYLNKGTDLILSGHTHGGQIRLPIIGGIIAPGQGLFPKYDKGIIELGETILYIDSGLGNSLYPIRLFNRVQITNIEVESNEFK